MIPKLPFIPIWETKSETKHIYNFWQSKGIILRLVCLFNALLGYMTMYCSTERRHYVLQYDFSMFGKDTKVADTFK